MFNLNLPSFSSNPVPLVLSSESLVFCLSSFFYILKGHSKVFPRLLLAVQSQLSWPFFTGEVFQSPCLLEQFGQCPCLSFTGVSWPLIHWVGGLLILEDVMWYLNINHLFWAPLSSRALSYGALLSRSPCLWDPELHHLVVIATKAAFDLHTSDEPLLVSECEFTMISNVSSHTYLNI